MILKLKNKLTLLNSLSKLIVLAIIAFLLPRTISNILIINTDKQLLLYKGTTLEIIDSLSISHFIDESNKERGFGDYGLFKDDYISIFSTDTSFQKNHFEFAEVEIENEIKSYRILNYTFQSGNNHYVMEIGKSIESIVETEYIVRKYVFLALAITIVLSILIDALAFYKIMMPFYQLIDKIKTFDKPEDFKFEKSDTTTYDFIYLENTIYGLLKKIQKLFSQEREFIGNVSHELLTPISIIKSKLDNLLLNSNINDRETFKLIELKKTLHRLTRIVRSLLLMSRIENEEFILDEYIDLNEMCNDLYEEIADRFEAKKIKFKKETDNMPFSIYGNKDLIYTMLFNALTNAAKFTPEKGIVLFQLNSDKKTISIKDNGIGIEKEKLKNIFDRHKSFSKDSNSFGLGLALVKKISECHHIQIAINSSIDKGTELSFHF